jgi:hypothetical protein
MGSLPCLTVLDLPVKHESWLSSKAYGLSMHVAVPDSLHCNFAESESAAQSSLLIPGFVAPAGGAEA